MRHLLLLTIGLLPLAYLIIVYDKLDPIEKGLHSAISADPARREVQGDVLESDETSIKGIPQRRQHSACEMDEFVRYSRAELAEKDFFFSPARHPQGAHAPVTERKYVLFGFDPGGFNNIRMAFEVAVVFAHASGRILVMPPKKRLYLLDKDPEEEDNMSGFEAYFDLERLRGVLDIISMEDFIRDVAVPGLLNVPWKQEYGKSEEQLWRYLEKAAYMREWEPGRFHIGFNLSVNNNTGGVDFGTFGEKQHDLRQKLHGSHDRKLIHYNAAMHNHRAVYFPSGERGRLIKYRLITHFYSYIHFADARLDRQYKRFVRDRIMYRPEIFCAAGRVVRLLREEALAASIKRGHRHTIEGMPVGAARADTRGTYYAYHIRRGDFQYKATRLSGATIWNNTKELLDASISPIIYIATDEKDKREFRDFKGGIDRLTLHPRFKVRYLRDYTERALLGHSTGRMGPNWHGMIEQIVCASAHTFFGTPLSTFTGYITRLRGYFHDNRYSRTLYFMPKHMYVLHSQVELKGPFWSREFAVATEDIDDTVDGGMDEAARLQRRVSRAHTQRLKYADRAGDLAQVLQQDVELKDRKRRDVGKKVRRSRPM